MKRLFISLLLLLPLFGYGQGSELLPQLVATSAPEKLLLGQDEIRDFIQPLKNNVASSDVALLKKVFFKVQKEFLHHYSSYPDFSEIFDSGQFDCLTATALFSVVLGELHFDYSIIETNYHIFLLVKTSKGEVLLETTDRFNGFVRNEKAIRQRIGTYRQGLVAGNDKNILRFRCDLYRKVDPGRLPGLLYFNQAVRAYNAGRLEACGQLLAKAKSIYDTPRISEFGMVFLKSVVESSLDDPTKLKIIQEFRGITPPTVLASR